MPFKMFGRQPKNVALNEREVQVALGTEETCCADCIYRRIVSKDKVGSNGNVHVCSAVEQERGRDRITGEAKWNNKWVGWERSSEAGWTTNSAFQYQKASAINDGHCKYFKHTSGKPPSRKRSIEVPVYVCIGAIGMIIFLFICLVGSRLHG